VLILTRKQTPRTTDAPHKSRVNIYRDDELIGAVDVLYAGAGMARLGFEFAKDYRIAREEVEACEGKGGAE